jgi:3-dehydroquinate synthase II
MQIWLNCIELLPKNIPKGIDYILSSKSLNSNNPYFRIDSESKLYENEEIIGKMVTISSEKEQEYAISLIGSVKWILIKCKDWKMIPCENLIAAAESSGTKLAAIVEKELEIPAIAFALEIGVDALVVTQELVELALITKSQCLEKNMSSEKAIQKKSTKLNLEPVKISNISTQGIGERICIDTTSFLEKGEGMLCGSVAKSLALIHAETIDSEFVPTRPFRVNAGGIHSYIMMGDHSTRYLSELKSGNEVLIINQEGNSRIVNIGRIKLEKRPLIRIEWNTSNDTFGNVILQQAETVRLLDENMMPISITEIKKDMKILIHNSTYSRHIGTPISTFSQEY